MRSSFFAAAALIALPAGNQALATYSFTAIADPSGTSGTIANGINNAGVVVGASNTGAGDNGFTYNGNTFSDFSAPGALSTVESGISANGSIIGYYEDGSGAYHGFTLSPAFSSFDAPFAGAVGATYGTGINQAGAATVGYFFDPSSVSHGFLNSTQIDATNSTSTTATGINNAGTMVGYYTDATGIHGFVRSAGGTYSPIDDPLATGGTYATGINDLGQITGYYVDAAGTHGFVLTGTDFVTIDAPAALGLTEVNGINDAGEIVGYELNAATGLDQGFIATVVPEPATLSILGFGALALLTARRRRAV